MDALRDLKHAVALLRRERSFTAAALLRPLPYPAANRLVRIYEEHPGAPRPPGVPETSNITLNAWTPRLRTPEDIALLRTRVHRIVS